MTNTFLDNVYDFLRNTYSDPIKLYSNPMQLLTPIRQILHDKYEITFNAVKVATCPENVLNDLNNKSTPLGQLVIIAYLIKEPNRIADFTYNIQAHRFEGALDTAIYNFTNDLGVNGRLNLISADLWVLFNDYPIFPQKGSYTFVTDLVHDLNTWLCDNHSELLRYCTLLNPNGYDNLYMDGTLASLISYNLLIKLQYTMQMTYANWFVNRPTYTIPSVDYLSEPNALEIVRNMLHLENYNMESLRDTVHFYRNSNGLTNSDDIDQALLVQLFTSDRKEYRTASPLYNVFIPNVDFLTPDDYLKSINSHLGLSLEFDRHTPDLTHDRHTPDLTQVVTINDVTFKFSYNIGISKKDEFNDSDNTISILGINQSNNGSVHYTNVIFQDIFDQHKTILDRFINKFKIKQGQCTFQASIKDGKLVVKYIYTTNKLQKYQLTKATNIYVQISISLTDFVTFGPTTIMQLVTQTTTLNAYEAHLINELLLGLLYIINQKLDTSSISLPDIKQFTSDNLHINLEDITYAFVELGLLMFVLLKVIPIL